MKLYCVISIDYIDFYRTRMQGAAYTSKSLASLALCALVYQRQHGYDIYSKMLIYVDLVSRLVLTYALDGTLA